MSCQAAGGYLGRARVDMKRANSKARCASDGLLSWAAGGPGGALCAGGMGHGCTWMRWKACGAREMLAGRALRLLQGFSTGKVAFSGPASSILL
jgi:hypothetical protein